MSLLALVIFLYSFLSHMEQNGILESTNIIDLFCLHYIFCPRINHQLSLFVEAWNHHPLRTEGNWTPQQIWVNDMISQDNAENTAVRDIFEEDMQVSDLYGEDPGGPPPNNFDLGSVEVPDTILPINGSQLEAISHIQPLSERNDYGVSLYLDLMSGLHCICFTINS